MRAIIYCRSFIKMKNSTNQWGKSCEKIDVNGMNSRENEKEKEEEKRNKIKFKKKETTKRVQPSSEDDFKG